MLLIYRTIIQLLVFTMTMYIVAVIASEAVFEDAEHGVALSEACGTQVQYAEKGDALDACRPVGTVFRDAPGLPEMVAVLGPDQALMAVGRFEVTFEEWQRCHDDGFCRRIPSDNDWGRGRRPVINVAPREVEQFLAWLSEVSGVAYRGMTDAEWLHIAKSGSDEPATHENAHFDADQTLEVGTLKPSPAGLYDMLGNVWEMTSQCEAADYDDPRRCFISRSRGGSWANVVAYVSADSVNALLVEEGNRLTGFRVARDMRLFSPPPGYLDRIYPSNPASAPDPQQ